MEDKEYVFVGPMFRASILFDGFEVGFGVCESFFFFLSSVKGYWKTIRMLFVVLTIIVVIV